jgi:arabinose-5-phosphate isomerase
MVSRETPMAKVIAEISRAGFGLAIVTDKQKKLLGVITDGDLRRWFPKTPGDWRGRTAADCMKTGPTTISRDEIATRALKLMESRKITALPVVDTRGRVEGLLHLHDLWRTQWI